MTFLLTGGSGNGKSTYARELAKALCQKRIIVTTGLPEYGAALEVCGFDTVTCCTDIGSAAVPHDCAVIVECLCNLAANEMFEPKGAGDRSASAIISGIETLAKRCRHLIVVTNEVGADGVKYDAAVCGYINTLGEINRRLAMRFDNVYELCAGLPVVLKGSLELDNKRGGGDMTLIIGGRASGRREYVKTLGFSDDDIADGVLDSRPVLYNLQKLVAQDPDGAMDMLPKLQSKQVIICDEVGSGIIPDNEAQTNYRVATGALCNALASEAKRVVRVVCGIPTVIK